MIQTQPALACLDHVCTIHTYIVYTQHVISTSHVSIHPQYNPHHPQVMYLYTPQYNPHHVIMHVPISYVSIYPPVQPPPCNNACTHRSSIYTPPSTTPTISCILYSYFSGTHQSFFGIKRLVCMPL